MGIRTLSAARMGAVHPRRSRYKRAVAQDAPIITARNCGPMKWGPTDMERQPPYWAGLGPFDPVYNNTLHVTPEQTVLIPGEAGSTLFDSGAYTDLGPPVFHPTGSTGACTFEVVCQPTDVVTSFQMLATVFSEWQVWIADDGSIYADVGTDGSPVMSATSAASTAVAGVPQHILVTYDRATPLIEIWRNGVSVASSTSTSGSFSSSGYNLYLGRRADFGGSPFSGALGWFALYDHALSPARIAEHAAAAAAGGR